MASSFIKVMGDSLRVKIIEEFLDARDVLILDAGDIADMLGIKETSNRYGIEPNMEIKVVQENIDALEALGIVTKKYEKYRINTENEISKALIECQIKIAKEIVKCQKT